MCPHLTKPPSPVSADVLYGRPLPLLSLSVNYIGLILFVGGDQGLLNLFFHDWSTRDISRRLPFLYNLVTQACTMYQPAFKQLVDQNDNNNEINNIVSILSYQTF